MTRTLYSLSERESVSRGTIVIIPALTPASQATVGPSIRLDAGTWCIQVARLVTGVSGHEVASGPPATDPTWPIVLLIRHGRGAASWTEVIACTARGTLLVRSNDLMELALGVAGVAGVVAEQLVLLAARQLIVPLMPIEVQTQAIAVVVAFVTVSIHNVPPGARMCSYIGPAFTALVWSDAAGVPLNAQGTVPLAGQDIHIPSTAVTATLVGGVAGDLSIMTWEVYG